MQINNSYLNKFSLVNSGRKFWVISVSCDGIDMTMCNHYTFSGHQLWIRVWSKTTPWYINTFCYYIVN